MWAENVRVPTVGQEAARLERRPLVLHPALKVLQRLALAADKHLAVTTVVVESERLGRGKVCNKKTKKGKSIQN